MDFNVYMGFNFIEMGIYYGDVHYGLRISKKVVIEDDIFLEPVYELLFDESREDDLTNISNVYFKLSDPQEFTTRSPLSIVSGIPEFTTRSPLSIVSGIPEYRYELLVDVFTTYDGVQSCKGWQVITAEQMAEFVSGNKKIQRG